LGFTVERSSDAGSNWTTLVTNEESVDLGSGTAGRYRYEDDTVANTVTYRYRVTAFIGSAMSASATSADVTVNNGSSPVAQDDFESYVPASNLGSASSAANWEAINDNVVVYNPLLVGPASVYGGGAGGTTTSMAKSTATFSANHRSEATAVTLSAGSFSFAALGVRCQSGAATFYAFLVDGSNWYVMDFIAAVQHVITNGTSTVSDGDLFAIEASGAGSSTRLKIQKFHSGSWTDIATNIDPGTSHYIDNGAPGVGGSSANATFGRVDDWKGFDL
jgi:hypothetical protein